MSIRVPSEEDKSDIIRIEGDTNGVAVAKAQVIEMVSKMVSFRRKTILTNEFFRKKWSYFEEIRGNRTRCGALRKKRDRKNQNFRKMELSISMIVISIDVCRRFSCAVAR